MGIEPTSEAWEASILPLYDARSGAIVPANGLAEKRCPHESNSDRVTSNCRLNEVVACGVGARFPSGALALAQQCRAVFLTLRERSFSVKICRFAVTASVIVTRETQNAHAERLHWQTRLLR